MTEPREFVLPECPDDVLQVVSNVGDRVFTRSDAHSHHWCDDDGVTFTWSQLLDEFPSGLREVVETGYEAAVRRLREAGFWTRGGFPTAGPDEVADIRTVLIHALWGSE